MRKIYRQWLCMAVLLCQITAQAAENGAVVRGSVKDVQGNPIAGVVVTDGKNMTATDNRGMYLLDTDPVRQPMVYISTPADYVLPEKMELLMDSIAIRMPVKRKINATLYFRNGRKRRMNLSLFLFQTRR